VTYSANRKKVAFCERKRGKHDQENQNGGKSKGLNLQNFQ